MNLNAKHVLAAMACFGLTLGPSLAAEDASSFLKRFEGYYYPKGEKGAKAEYCSRIALVRKYGFSGEPGMPIGIVAGGIAGEENGCDVYKVRKSGKYYKLYLHCTGEGDEYDDTIFMRPAGKSTLRFKTSDGYSYEWRLCPDGKKYLPPWNVK